jgi:hypothetical protein
MYFNTTGTANSALGFSALQSNTTGSSNTAIGQNALLLDTTGQFNTAVGRNAGYNTTTGTENLYLGYYAGYSNSTGENNSYIGPEAGYATTTSNNTFVGVSSGAAITSGAKNTILGRYSGNQGGLDIRGSSNNVVLSDGDGNVRQYINSSGGVFWGMGQADYTNGVSMTSDATYIFFQTFNSKPLVFNNLGNSILMPGVYGNTNANAANMFIGTDGTLYRSVSSEKYKTDIQTASYGLADVMNLRAVTYRSKSSISKNDAGEETTVNASEHVFGGLIAEEVHSAGLTQFVQYAEDGTPDALSYGHMVSLAFKAIQEQQAIIESLKARLDAANL